MNKNQDKGFTLVELLIVIVILGILATVTVFAVGGVTSTASENACQVEEKNLETAVQAYFAGEQVSVIAGANQAAYYTTLQTENYLNDDFPVADFTLTDAGVVGRAGDCA